MAKLDKGGLFNLIVNIIPPSIAITGMILMWVATFSGLKLKDTEDLDFWAPLVFISGIGMQIYWLYKRDIFR